MVQTADRSTSARRELRLPEAKEQWVRTADGVDLRLTRFEAGGRGPVILAPGFGTTRSAFLLDTIDLNFPEFLAEHGYDIWVFEYRASPELESSKARYTIDEIARYDYPAAVETVRRETGAESVQVVAHCVGSKSFLMAQLAGLEGVRSAVSSCLTLHPVGPRLNRLRARGRLAEIMDTIGIKRMSTTFNSDQLDDRILDVFLRVYPGVERCDDPVCRRVKFMYGDTFAHDQLNEETHANLAPLFGRASVYTFRHITRMMRRGHVVDADGRDTYLPNLNRLRMPITFIHGERNNLFLPEGSRKTYDLLREAHGDDLYRRHVVAGYAHMDLWIGKDASRDVYPLVLGELERYN
jgi:choline dehydrogenase-like flavoprotein